jgi:D-sedoheptulose 7-phosphate isomerase
MIAEFLTQVKKSINKIDELQVEKVIEILEDLRTRKGRLFIVGSGGSAGNASHAAADFRKLCEIESYSFDNISELTARTNDEGWNNTTASWLAASNFRSSDCLFVLSVGGGMPNVSGNLVNAIMLAAEKGSKIVGIVGNKLCTLTEYADASIVIETKKFKTPVVEGLQSVYLHMIVTNLQLNSPVW